MLMGSNAHDVFITTLLLTTTPMGSMFIEIVKLRLTKKGGGKGSDVELWRESAYDSNGTDLHMGLYVLWLRYGEKS